MDSLLASYASSDEEEEEQGQHHEDTIPKPISKSDDTCSISSQTPQDSRIFSSLPQPKSSSAFPSLPQPKNSSAFPSLPQPKNSSAFPSLPQPKNSSAFPSLPQPKSSTAFSSLPQPESSSCAFSSLPQPKSSSVFSSLPPAKSSSIFSSLPPPTSANSQTSSNPSCSDPKPKKVVQFRPPVMLKPPKDEDDDEEEEKQRKTIKEPTASGSTSSLSSFFSSLPAPKNTLGSGSAPALGAGAGRRSIVETDIPESNYEGNEIKNKGVSVNGNQEHYAVDGGDASYSISASEPLTTGSNLPNWTPNDDSYGSYGYYEANGSYGAYEASYGNYDGASTIPPTAMEPQTLGFVETVPEMMRKRGRKEIPADIVEVKQDELMKNRPREDQVKMTGIAFGPSYQPVTTKGKPTKLHKRKHQIGALYFDMRQKEHELAERRSKGFLTKAETQAKYGW